MTLATTDVAARGLDVDDITHVINFDPPHGHDDYIHRVGRTGRAGRSGTGVTFVPPEQRGDVSKMAGRLGHGQQFTDSGMVVSTKPGPGEAGQLGRATPPALSPETASHARKPQRDSSTSPKGVRA